MRQLDFFGRACLTCAIGLALACGCSPRRIVCDVAGTITLKAAPLAEAQVELYSPKLGLGALATVSTGTFVFPRTLEPGEYAITIHPTQVFPAGDPDGRPLPPKVKIPKKYQDMKTSGLTVTLRAGKNSLELDLE